MKPEILLAYATRYGSTEETARVVASVLGAEGFSVDVKAVEDVKELGTYSAVVLAAALYVGRLHRHARRFLKTWRHDLEHVPVALIVPGPLDSGADEFAGAEAQLDKELKRMPWLRPFARRIVGGRWDPAKLGFVFRWTLRNQPARDARDWPAIRAFGLEIAAKLESLLAHPKAS